MIDIKKLLKQPNETQLKIERARYLWGVIRRKKLVLTMLKNIQADKTMTEFLERLKNNEHQKQDEKDPLLIDKKKSRFIISTENIWNLQRNNFIQLVFVCYILICPTIVVNNTYITAKHQGLLLIFDFTFMLDRVFDLFVGFKNPNGNDETSLTQVIRVNLQTQGFKFFQEIFISLMPMVVSSVYYPAGESVSTTYGCFKLIRYLRLPEMQS